ncbi:hypothetical protein [Hymenobacter arcticus]
MLLPEGQVWGSEVLLHKRRVPEVAPLQGVAPKSPTAARRGEAGGRHRLPHAGRQARRPVRKVVFGEPVVRELVVAVRRVADAQQLGLRRSLGFGELLKRLYLLLVQAQVGMAGNQQIVDVHRAGSESPVHKDKPRFIFGPTFRPYLFGHLSMGPGAVKRGSESYRFALKQKIAEDQVCDFIANNLYYNSIRQLISKISQKSKH